MSTDPTERRLSAILSADAADFTRHMAQDQVATVRTVTAYRDQIAALVRQHRGRVVDSPGDNLLAEFASATDAVICSQQVQRSLAARNAKLPADQRIEFRIGVHLGEVAVQVERIYGDGVNVAARIRTLAESGGICLSKAVHEQVRTNLDLDCEDLGEQRLKNVATAVGVLRLQPSPSAEPFDESMPGSTELTVPGFSGRPAIAVLPFENMSGDQEQEHFADGMVEDLITRMSATRWFPVIARNSTFAYKANPVDVKRVGQDLGARYIVEGSVRKSGTKVRISAQLIDATTGHHLWAKKYDRELMHVFDLQDEITDSIVSAIEPELRKQEPLRALRRNPSNLTAWECLQRGYWHLGKFSREDNALAMGLFRRAIELENDFATAFGALGLSLVWEAVYGWSESPGRSLAEAIRVGERAVALDDMDPSAHRALGGIYGFAGQPEQALRENELSVELDPSYALGYWGVGQTLALQGRAEEGVAMIQKAIRLSPNDPLMDQFLGDLALAYFAGDRHEEAAEYANRSLKHQRRGNRVWPILIASLSYLGRSSEAQAVLGACSANDPPEFTLDGLIRVLEAMRADPDVVKRLVLGLREAGVAE